MKSVMVRFQEYAPKASGAEKGIVKFLLESPELVAGCSIQQLAGKTFSSPSTIIRLCHKTGFEGYKDFHKSLLYELAVRKEAGKEFQEELCKDDGLENIVNKVTYKNMVALEKTKKLADSEVLEKCVDLLVECRHICFFGMGASLLVAKDAYLKFLRVDKSCFINDDWHAQLLQAKNMKKKDAALIISYSGMTGEMLQCAKTVKESGAPIIAITRFEDSALRRMADYNLCVSAPEYVFRSGAMTSRISQLNMIDILYTAYINRQHDKSVEQLKKTHIKKDILLDFGKEGGNDGR